MIGAKIEIPEAHRDLVNQLREAADLSALAAETAGAVAARNRRRLWDTVREIVTLEEGRIHRIVGDPPQIEDFGPDTDPWRDQAADLARRAKLRDQLAALANAAGGGEDGDG